MVEKSLLGRLRVDDEALPAFCRRWEISELAVFGSVLRDDFGEASDVDVLVTFHAQGVNGSDRGWLSKIVAALAVDYVGHGFRWRIEGYEGLQCSLAIRLLVHVTAFARCRGREATGVTHVTSQLAVRTF